LLDDCIKNLKQFGDPFGPAKMMDYWGGHQIYLGLKQTCEEHYDSANDMHIFT